MNEQKPQDSRKKTMSEIADELEHEQFQEFETVFAKAYLYNLAEGVPALGHRRIEPHQRMHMGDDPRLPPLPEKPTLIDFFHQRFAHGQQHLLQSANLARKNGLPEKIVLACLLHDIAVVGFICGDHGYWGEQLIAPYVDEEIAWAIRMHQALRFYPDESVGYEYPERYREVFGADYVPEPHVQHDYEVAKNHKWYMTARQITCNDLYSFDPDVVLEVEEFEDVIGRHFKQPAEGLGNDNSPVAHMWRCIRRPCNAL